MERVDEGGQRKVKNAISPYSTPRSAPGFVSHKTNHSRPAAVIGYTAQDCPRTAASAISAASDPNSCMRF